MTTITAQGSSITVSSGRYAITAHGNGKSYTGTDRNKRLAIRTCRRETKRLGDGATGEVSHAIGLLYQCAAYTTDAGSIKVRVLEL